MRWDEEVVYHLVDGRSAARVGFMRDFSWPASPGSGRAANFRSHRRNFRGVSQGLLRDRRLPKWICEDLDFRSVHYYPHTNYAVYSEDGKLVRKVTNAIGVHDEDPALVEMPGGKYVVLAESERYGMVKVKVVIEPGKLTTVNLEYNKQPPSGLSKGNNDLVRLPDGSIVGERAEGSTQANAVGPTQVK